MKKKLLLGIFAIVLLAITVAACNVTPKFKLNFIVDGEVYATIDTDGGGTIALPENPVKDEYVFDGWYWDEGIWQRPFTVNSLLDEKLNSDMSVYAKWIEEDITKRTYTVTFNSMGGSAVGQAAIKYGNLIPEPARPEKAGYALVGWYKEADFSEKWNFATDTVTGDITLYAKWADESAAAGCEVLNARGFVQDGNILSARVANSTEHFALSEAITVSPYAVWKVTSDIAGRNEIPSATVTLAEGDNTYYINVTTGNGSNKKQYTVNIHRRYMFTVTYEPNNGGGQIIENVEEDSKTENKHVIKTGYSFKEWQHNGVVWNFESEITEDITLVAVWEANDYEVTFDSVGGNDVQKKTVTYGGEFTFDVPVKKGYEFKGWKTQGGDSLTDDTGKGLAVWNIADDEMLYADWQTIEYTIAYHNAEEADNKNAGTYTVEQENITLTPATKTGYNFIGWFTEEECENRIEQIDTSKAENVELWAGWEAIQYTATFKTEDSEVKQVKFTVETEELEEPPVPQKDGYDGAWESYSLKAEDLTINAVYSVVEYNIIYKDTKEAENANRSTYNIEDDTFELLPLEATGYKFNGWYDEHGQVTQVEQGSYGEKTLTAHWEVVKYTITYQNTKEATNPNPETYDIEQEVELKPLQKEGYTFNGWFACEEEVKKIEVGSTEAKVFEAKWTPINYTIKYLDTKEAENANRNIYNIEDETFELLPLEVTGYKFNGWYDEHGQVTQIEQGSYGEKTLTAHWEVVIYTITYQNTKEAANPNKTEYTIEDNTCQLKDITANGYSFKGWFENGEKITEIKQGSFGKKTIVAKWEVVEYQIKYENTKEAENLNKIKYTIEDATFELQPLEKIGYKFDGWFENGRKVIQIEIGSFGEKILTAKWILVKYQLHLEYNKQISGYADGESNPTEYTIESNFKLKPLVIKAEGYTAFLGWYTERDCERGEIIDSIVPGKTGDLFLYAHWELEIYTISYHNDEGTININPINYTIESEPITISEIAKIGYNFEGWYSDPNLQNEADITIETGSHGNLDFYAKWSLVTYTITYILNGGNYVNGESNPEFYTIEDSFKLKNPVKDKNIFDGWYETTEGNKITEIIEGTTGKLTLYARWKEMSPITTVEELKAIEQNNTLNYYLANDINLKGENWSPIVNFFGVLDGRGFKIFNFSLSVNSDVNRVDIGFILNNSGVIKNLSFDDFTFNVMYYGNLCEAGVIAAVNNGTIYNCKVANGQIQFTNGKNLDKKNFNMSANFYIGNIAGRNSGTIEECTSEVDISGSQSLSSADMSVTLNYVCCVGGITGQNDSLVKGCVNKADLTIYLYSVLEAHGPYANRLFYTNDAYIGGCIGKNASLGVCVNSYSEAENNFLVSAYIADDDVYLYSSIMYGTIGGLIGRNDGEVTSCFAKGAVMGSANDNSGCGGLVGFNGANGNLTNCYSTCEVSATRGLYNVGGFVGTNEGSIINCFSSGNVSTTIGGFIGGFCGDNRTNGRILKSFSYGSVKVTGNAGYGHMIGSNSGLVNGGYYSEDVILIVNNGIVSESGGAGQTRISQTKMFSIKFLLSELYWETQYWFIDGVSAPTLLWEQNA